MKVKKRILKSFISMLLICSMVFTSFFRVEASVTNLSKEVHKTVIKGDGYEVIFNVTSRWDGAFNCEISLKNTSSDIIDNWALEFDMPHEITSIWNGVVNSNQHGRYIIKNAGSNQDVLPGKSIKFGFSATYVNEIQLPVTLSILNFEEVVEPSRYEICFNVTSDWKTAFNGEIRIKNISDKVIEDWRLKFDFDINIERFWTAKILEHTGSQYYIKNADYNANIKPGETLVLGIAGNPGNVKTLPTNYILSEIVLENPEVEDEVDLEKDTDNDGLVDMLELALGTDPYNPDTDGDGLSDYIEIMLDLDPLNIDTDGNGIEDGFEDTDEDELNNLEELKVGTDCIKPDTDNDGILDGDEVKIYKTSPILEDTDGDTISDGDEIRLGLNPLKAYSDDITHDSKRKFQQSLSEENIEPYLMDSENLLVPYINGLVSDVIDKNIYVRHYNNDAIQDNRAIIGDPVRIHSSYTEEDELTLGFNYSGFLSYYAEDDLNTLVICRYIEDDFLPLETELDKLNRTLNANITGGGIYFVLDLEEFLSGLGIYTQKSLINNDVDIRSFDEEFVILSVDDESVANNVPEEWLEEYDSNRTKNNLFDSQVAVSNHDLTYSVLNKSLRNSVKGQADITFVIDTTGSMYSAIYNVQNNISKFVDRLTSEYNVKVNFALVDYKDITDDGLDSTRVIKNGTSNWFSNVEMYKNKISNLYINGGGDTPETAIDGLAMAYNLDYRSNANKFVVLVTDADYKVNNQYGIKSMNEISDMLKSKNIITSVIAPTYYRSYYTTLYQNTDGIFADIYGDFSSELLKLADRIGEAVNDGTWVLLSDYQYVKLDAEVSPTNGVDTDEDGISDYRELGVKEERDLSQLVKLLLKIKGIPEELYEGKTSVTVYRYITNPVLVDTDFDGLNDNDSRDLVKRDNGLLDANAFSGDIIGYFKVPIKIDFTVDYSQFFIKSNTSYHRDLSVLGSIYATAAYHGDVNVTSGARQSGKLIDIYRLFGLQDVKNYKLAAEFSDDDISEVFIGHRLVEYKGEKKDIIFVSVRGTNGTIQEWSSNFDVGANTDDYWDRNNIYWRNKSNHKGFDATANRVYDYITEYVENNVSKDAKKVIYITGHSRGAGISNILGSQFEKKSDYETYIYTFACPNTTTDVNASTYKTIFNIVNSDDIITYLPLEEWNFGKYGQTEPYTISVKQYYEDSSPFKNKVGTYEWLVGKDYNNDGGTKRTLKAFVKVAKDREELYKYDMTKDGVVNPHNKYHTTIKGAQEQLEKVKQELIDQRLDQLSYAYIDDGILKNVLVRYKPAFLMQVLANMTCGVGPTLGFDVNGKYASAKTSFVATSGTLGVGGMKSPHCQESYYLIARNNFKPLP